MDGLDLLPVLSEAASAVRLALDELGDWGLAGTRAGQYKSDLAADRAAIDVLGGNGIDVLSEESGRTGAGSPLLAILDPVDGSTNASRGIPWFATAICVLDETGPLASLVVNQASGRGWHAVRDRGAHDDEDRPLHGSGVTELGSALVGISGYPARHLGWRQHRALGAAALDLCLVAAGRLDGYIDCSTNAHGPWDYMASLLVCTEAGVAMEDALGRDLVVREHHDRRTPLAAATPALLAELRGAGREAGQWPAS